MSWQRGNFPLDHYPAYFAQGGLSSRDIQRCRRTVIEQAEALVLGFSEEAYSLLKKVAFAVLPSSTTQMGIVVRL